MFQSPGWLSAGTRCRCQRQKSVKNQGNSALGNRWNYDENSGNGNDGNNRRWISLPQGTNCPMQLLPSSPARFLLFQIIKIQSGIFLHALLLRSAATKTPYQTKTDPRTKDNLPLLEAYEKCHRRYQLSGRDKVKMKFVLVFGKCASVTKTTQVDFLMFLVLISTGQEEQSG